MPKSKKSKISATDMVAKFENYAVAKTELQGKQDVKGSNRAFDKLMKLASVIRTTEDGGRGILEELILSKHDAVRLTAAYLLLPINPELASCELLSIANNSSNVFLASSARVTLEEWATGKLDTDWFVKKYGAKPSKRLN